MLSPPKKATDHSINSIISSAAAPVISHSKNDNPKSAEPPSSSGGGTKLINLDNLTTNDILTTAAAASTTTTEPNLRIKSVESLNKMVPKNSTTATNPSKPATAPKDKHKSHGYRNNDESGSQSTVLKASAVGVPSISPTDSIIKSTSGSKSSQSSNQKTNFAMGKPTALPKSSSDKPTVLSSHAVEEISSDSDDVEFVSETHLKKIKVPNMIKHVKTSNSSSRSSSPSVQAQTSLLKRRRDSSIDGKEELDVDHIMEALKELQVLAQTHNSISGDEKFCFF